VESKWGLAYSSHAVEVVDNINWWKYGKRSDIIPSQLKGLESVLSSSTISDPAENHSDSEHF